MIPRNNPEKFLKDVGRWWYIREFDYLPEPLEYYSKNLSTSAINLIINSQHGYRSEWRLFKSYADAKKASNDIRKTLGLKPKFVDLEANV